MSRLWNLLAGPGGEYWQEELMSHDWSIIPGLDEGQWGQCYCHTYMAHLDECDWRGKCECPVRGEPVRQLITSPNEADDTCEWAVFWDVGTFRAWSHYDYGDDEAWALLLEMPLAGPEPDWDHLFGIARDYAEEFEANQK